ncbi:hypothetical protein [Streptococcus sp. 20-1249]|uniref:hypothetical protein n=1 Tax=Streptococcus hepaticus TaxID=3349163 RepID=UPI00374A6DE2
MVNFIKYGTNSKKEIWLLTYGSGFEDIEWMKPFVIKIDQKEIRFDKEILNENEDRISKIERFYYDN